MANPFLGEIRMWPSDAVAAPNGWAFCNGQVLPINQNQALFALLGTAYGGDGQTTFALPDLRERVVVGVGNGFTLGQVGGEAAHTVTVNELPTHQHQLMASNTQADAVATNGNVLAVSQGLIYNNPTQTTPDPAALEPSSIANVGGSQPHENRQPFLTISFIIALQGVFPS